MGRQLTSNSDAIFFHESRFPHVALEKLHEVSLGLSEAANIAVINAQKLPAVTENGYIFDHGCRRDSVPQDCDSRDWVTKD